MKSQLSIEWLKVKKYRTFWVLIGFFIVLLPAWNYAFTTGIMKVGGNEAKSFFKQAYNFEYIWGMLSYWTSYLVMIISLLIIILTTNEYTFRTNRQSIIDGWKREKFYHAKWLLVISAAALTTLYVFLIGLLFGSFNDSFANFPGEIKPLLHLFILSLNYYGFGLLLGVLFKRSGLAIGMLILYSIILEYILSSAINWLTKGQYGNFLPLESSDKLLPIPINDVAKAMMGIENSTSDWQYILASCIWIVIYYLIGRMRLLKSDW